MLCSLSAFPQENVFILVDVSGSRAGDAIKGDAKNQMLNLIIGQYSPNGWSAVNVSDKRISELINKKSNQPLLENSSYVCLIPFGEKDTYKKYSLVQIRNVIDFQDFYNRTYPTKFNDGFTYIQIAEAFTASLAKTYRINDYYMFVITDGLGDQDDTNSKNTYDSFEDSLLLGWGNESSSIVKNIGALVKSKYYINLKRVTNVNSTSIPINKTIEVLPPTISLTSYIGGTKDRPKDTNSGSFTVTWNCNCPTDTKFNVALTQIDGGNYKDLSKKNIVSNSAKFSDVPSGKYKIVVSSSDANSAMTYIKIPSSGLGIWIVLLFLLAGGVTGYYIWNKKRQQKIEAYSNDQPEDIFTKGTGTTSNSSNTDYF